MVKEYRYGDGSEPNYKVIRRMMARSEDDYNEATDRTGMKSYASTALIISHAKYLSEHREAWEEFAGAVGHNHTTLIRKIVGAYRWEWGY